MSLKHKLAAHDPNLTTVKQYAEIGILPPYLGVNDLAELWAEGTEISKEAHIEFLKIEIENGELACMSLGQWVALSDERRKLFHHTRLPKIKPPQKGTSMSIGLSLFGSMHATTPSSWVPEDSIGGYIGDTSGMTAHEKENAARLYMANRTEFKKWLQKKDEWPLPEECLLARWWDIDEGDNEADILQATATKQQEKAIQELINRVVQANPKALTVEIWNKLKEYDTDGTDGIIVKQYPEHIENIKGNQKDAFVEYSHPVRGTVYKPITLKAFQERCTRARKELELNSKP